MNTLYILQVKKPAGISANCHNISSEIARVTQFVFAPRLTHYHNPKITPRLINKLKLN